MKAYLNEGKKPVEIARLLNRHRSTICRELKRGSVTQVQDKNGKLVYSEVYFPDADQRVYEENRKKSAYRKLENCSSIFLTKLEEAVKTKPRCHSVDSFMKNHRQRK